MPASIGVNLRVTGHCRQGGRKYMEDFFSVAYQQTEDERDLEYAFFGIYDGHGGAEAAAFAKEHLMETIIKHKTFWSDNDEDVLRAIKDGYIATHYAMWKEQEKWPRTASGLPSTAGTTASVAFIRRGKVYIGHVGDSGIILGYQEEGSTEWRAKPLTRDHKPENLDEMTRINQCGGKVVSKSGVPRVVWNRPKMGHQGPVRRSTPIDEIPFLAVARSLGDLWSYNSQINQFIVSPDPDCAVFTIDTSTHRCLVFGTDGLFNMLSPQNAVHIVQQAERHNENAALSDSINKTWLNPSKLLVEKALERWHNTKMRADNTSVVTLMLDPPGPPRAQVLKNRKKNAYPDTGLEIMTRYEEGLVNIVAIYQHYMFF
nr:PREDICTED: protein phosphatase 1D [Tribolium castaneum]|eukprot:XP_967669.1 PREDICTED: protein phosphatase 1D [Tribolium castaneum]